MIKTQYINLNMVPSGVMPILYCSQYDIGRPLGMVVYNGGESVDLDSYTCTIEATRTDGTAIMVAVTTSGNIGAFSTTATMTNKDDRYLAKLVLFDSNSRRVASFAFVMCVTPATMDENAESIEEDASLYQQYTGTVQSLIAAIHEDIDGIEGQLDNPGYYEGLTVTTGTYTNSEGDDTTYYLVTIPPTDPDGDAIPIEAAWDTEHTPLTHAQAEHTTLTTNTSLELNGSLPGVISGGEVVRASAWNQSAQYPYVVYVGFDSNRIPHEYSVDTPLQTMISAGIKEATVAYYRLVTDGVARDVSNIGLTTTQLRVNPRIAMFVKSDNTLCFIVCDGRDGSNEGLTPSELANLMVENGAVQGWNLDGGGSTSLVLKGSKLNRNIDGYGTLDRGVRVTWNVPHKFSNPSIQDAFSQVGIEKQRTIQQLIVNTFTNNVKTVTGKALLELSDGNYYVNNATDAPTTSDDGYAMVYEKYVSPANLKKVFWYPYNGNGIWGNTYNGTAWTGWKAMDVDYGLLRLPEYIPENSDLNDYTTPGVYVVANGTVAATIDNMPISTRGGKLIVSYATSPNAIQQQYTDVFGNDFYRYILSGDVYRWVNINGTKVISATVPASGKIRISGLDYLAGKITVTGSGNNGWGVADFVSSANVGVHLANVATGANTTIEVASDGKSIDISNAYTGSEQTVVLTLYSNAPQVFDVTATVVS